MKVAVKNLDNKKVKDLDLPETVFDYGLRVAEAWKVGQKGKDNGVIFLVAVEDRKARIEVALENHQRGDARYLACRRRMVIEHLPGRTVAP